MVFGNLLQNNTNKSFNEWNMARSHIY